MALALAESCSYGEEVQPHQLRVGQNVLALEVYFSPNVPSTGPSLGQREVQGVVSAVPPADSVGGYMHLRVEASEPERSDVIQVFAVGRGVAMFRQEQVASQVYFYSPPTNP